VAAITLEDAPVDIVVDTDPHTPAAPGMTFVDRAHQMVTFLAQRDGTAGDHRPEQALAEWISSWRRMPRLGLDATQHFVAEELGIIARALNGPAETARLRDGRTDDLCWLIARCISSGA
jgi:hypothetical protein